MGWIEISNELDNVEAKLKIVEHDLDKQNNLSFVGKAIQDVRKPNFVEETKREYDDLMRQKRELEQQLKDRLQDLDPVDLVIINHFLHTMNEERFILDDDLYDSEEEMIFNESLLRLSRLGILLPAIREGEPGYIIVDDNALSILMFGDELHEMIEGGDVSDN